MILVFTRIFFALVFPGALLTAAAFFALGHDAVSEFIQEFSWIFPYPVLGTAFFLTWRFNKSRLLYGIIILSIADWLLLRFAAGDVVEPARAEFLYHLLMVLLPFNFMIFSIWKERGTFTLWGVMRLGFVFIQVFLAVGCYKYWQAIVMQYLSFHSLHIPYLNLNLALPAVVANIGGLFLLIYRFLRYRDSMDHGFFWTLTLTFSSLLTEDPGPALSFLFSVGGLILIVAALESAHSMAYRDELTGLPGRRALNDTLLMMRGIYSVAMVDIDFFKKFNDRYGHDVGDQVLRMVAGKLKNVSGGGKPFRYGGEEFTILFPGKAKEQAAPYLEKLRGDVADSSFVIRGAGRPHKRPKMPKLFGKKKKVTVTVSIGLAERESRRQHPHALLKSADKALYRAKNTGRNRVAQ